MVVLCRRYSLPALAKQVHVVFKLNRKMGIAVRFHKQYGRSVECFREIKAISIKEGSLQTGQQLLYSFLPRGVLGTEFLQLDFCYPVGIVKFLVFILKVYNTFDSMKAYNSILLIHS